jgi:hypothetical protein
MADVAEPAAPPPQPSREADYMDLDHSVLALMRGRGETPVNEEVARWYMERGIELYRAGVIESAADHFHKAAALVALPHGRSEGVPPFDAYSLATWLGAVNQRMNRHPEARAYFMMALRLDPKRCVETGGVAEYLVRHGSAAETHEYFAVEDRQKPPVRLGPFFRHVEASFPAMVDRLGSILDRERPAGDRRPDVVIPVPVWGAKYVRTMLDYAVPCWLAPGNFPALSRTRRLSVVFFCDAESARQIEASAALSDLERFAGVAFITYDSRLMGDAGHHVARFQLFSLPHYVALECARRRDCDVAFAFPDNIVNDGFYGALGEVLANEPSAVVCQGFRLDEATVLPLIDGGFRRPGGAIAIPSSAVVDLLIKHLDPSWFADAPNFTTHPFATCWRVGDEGILARSSHFQPYAIRGRAVARPLSPRIDPMDGEFLYRYLSAPDKIVCVDTDRMCVFDAGGTPVLGNGDPSGPLSEYRYARFLHEYLTPVHRRYVDVPIRLGKAAPDVWREVEQRSRRRMAEILRIIDGFEAAAPVRPHWALRDDCR